MSIRATGDDHEGIGKSTQAPHIKGDDALPFEVQRRIDDQLGFDDGLILVLFGIGCLQRVFFLSRLRKQPSVFLAEGTLFNFWLASHFQGLSIASGWSVHKGLVGRSHS